MDKPEDNYMLLREGEYYFLIPLKWIRRITDSRMWRGRLLTAVPAGQGESPEQGALEYLILMEESAGDLTTVNHAVAEGGGELPRGVLTHEVVGIREVPAAQRFHLPGAVLGPDNFCLCGAAVLAGDEGELLAYLIDPESLNYVERDFSME